MNPYHVHHHSPSGAMPSIGRPAGSRVTRVTEGGPIARDPFARFDTWARRVYVEGRTCEWCGGVRTTKRETFLMQYGVSLDSLTRGTQWYPRLFCTRSCYRSYTGER